MQNQTYPPEDLLQRIANNPSVTDFVNSFPYVRHDVRQYLQKGGMEFANFRNILDLGCGVGRFLFAFQHELGLHQKLYGCDVYEACATWCRENIDFAETAHTGIEPPLPYQNDQFDFVYALSVFTHLRLDMQFKWAWEIYRVLEPGGILLVTLHGPHFIPLFFQPQFDVAQRREMYTVGGNGLFAYVSFSGTDADEGQVTVAAAQNLEFFKEQFSAFDLIGVFPLSNMAGEQDLYLVRKPLHGRTIAMPLSADAHLDTSSWAWKGGLTSGGELDSVSLQFDLDGHRKFRVYPRFSTGAFFSLDVEVEIQSESGTLVRHRAPLNNTRVFGTTHFAGIEVEIPDYKGAAEIRLRCLPRNAGAGLPPELTEIEWAFPNCT